MSLIPCLQPLPDLPSGMQPAGIRSGQGSNRVPRWPKITQHRKPKSVRLTEIRECVASGIHDPREIAERLGVSANLICRYANADNSIEVHPIRRGNRIGIRLHIKP